jgi:hypothetical protein
MSPEEGYSYGKKRLRRTNSFGSLDSSRVDHLNTTYHLEEQTQRKIERLEQRLSR